MTPLSVFGTPRVHRVALLLIGMTASGAGLQMLAQTARTLQGVARSETELDPTACAEQNAPQWCSGTDLGAWTNAAARYLCATSGGGHVSVPPGTFIVTTEIGPLCGGIDLYGAGSGSTLLETPADFEGRVLHLAGTPQAPLNGMHVHDMTLENGVPTTGPPTGGRDGLRCEYCTNLEIDHLVVTSIQGYYGIVTVNSSNASVHDNSVTNFAYGGIMNVVNSGGQSASVTIENNSVRGCVNTATGLCYGISISDSEDATVPFVTQGTVRGNTVSDIPTWECFDAHGGAGLTFASNTGANCYFGMQLGTVAGGALTNVTVADNALTQNDGTGHARANGYGIVLAGYSAAYPVVTATVTANEVTGFGSGPSGSGANVGAITLMSTADVSVTDNSIPTYAQAAIVLYGPNLNAKIARNTAGNLSGAYTPRSSSMIELASGGTWGAFVDGNTLATSSPAETPVALVSAGYANSTVSFGPNNRMSTPATSTATGQAVAVTLVAGGSVPMDLTQLPSSRAGYNFNYAPGTVGYDPAYQPAYSFAAPPEPRSPDGSTGFFALDATDVISTGNVTAGSTQVTGMASGLGGAWWFEWLPPGMNVAIAGAGSGGATLYAHVVANNGTALTLDTPAQTTLNHAAIRWQAGQVAAL